MRKSLLLIAVAMFSAQLVVAEAGQIHRYNDNPLLCRAVFGILVKVYEEGKDPRKVALYRAKFDRLAPEAEKELEASGQNKRELDTHIQRYAEDIVRWSLSDHKLLPHLVKFCDKTFP